MIVYFVYQKIITGGCELLIERLGKEMSNRSIIPYVVFQSIDTNMENRYLNAGLKLIGVTKWNRKNVISSIDPKKNSFLITFTWNDFLLCNIKQIGVYTFFYAVHYQAFEMGENKAGLIKQLLKRIGKNGIIRLKRNGQLICMDEQTIEYTKRYYDLEFFDLPIIRLAIDVVSPREIIVYNEKINILTIARADFPFKGYIVGLIEWFKTSSERTNLNIISYGKDEKVIVDKINALDDSVKNRISFVGKTDYNELEKYYQNADIYVGMGTTVLDASLRGIVSIPVQAYTTDLVADKFFFEDYSKVALDYGSKSSFSKLVERYIRANDTEKTIWSETSRKAVVDNYGTESVVDNLIRILGSAKDNRSSFGMDLLTEYHNIRSELKEKNYDNGK